MNSNSSSDFPWLPESDFQLGLRKLAVWKASLPPHLVFTRQNLFARLLSPSLGGIVMLHLWHDELICESHRAALHLYNTENRRGIDAQSTLLQVGQPDEVLEGYGAICLRAAKSIADSLRLLNDCTQGFQHNILDPSLPMICHSAIRNRLQLDIEPADTAASDYKILVSAAETVSVCFGHRYHTLVSQLMYTTYITQLTSR